MHRVRKWSVGAAFALAPAAFSLLFVWGSLRHDRVPSFRDQSDFFFPSHVYTASRLRSFSLPLWNPLSGNGESWIGSGQSEAFYPPALVFLLRNAAVATGAFLFFHFLLANFCFFGWLRSRSLGRPAATLGSAVFAFSGGAVSMSVYWNHFAGFAWLPAMAWAAQLGLTTRKQRAGFAVSLAAAVLAGSPEMGLFGLVLGAFIFFFETRRKELEQRETGRVRRRSWRLFAAAAISGSVLCAVQVFPIFDTVVHANARSSVWPGQIGIRQLAGSVAAPSLSPWPWLPAGAGYLQSIYVSLPILLLPVAAFALPERKRERAVWAALGTAALAAAMVPLEGPFRYPSKLFAIVLFAFALLAAEGLEGLRFAVRGRSAWVAAAAAALTSVAGVFLLSRAPAERATAAGLGLCLALLALADSADLGGAAAGLAAVFAAAHLVSATLPLGRSVSLSTLLSRPLPSRGKVLTSQDEILSEWASAALPDEAGRVRRQVDSLSGYTNLLFGVSKARTAGALPDLSQQIFMQSLTSLRNFLPVASISGCGEIRFPRGPKMARVLVPEPFAGATFFFEDRTDRDSLAALAAISSGAVDFRRVLTLASPSRLGTGRAGAGKDIALASRLTNTPEKIIYSVTLSRGAWLYLPMSWDRWWRASIDGRSAPIEKANGVFSAVLVPEGQHRLVWAYRPWPFYAGAALSGAGLLVLAAGLLSGEPPLRARASGTRGQ